MKVGWLCKHSGCMGMITLPDGESGMGEVAALIRESHSQSSCKIGGYIWIVMDSEREITIAPSPLDDGGIEARIKDPSQGQLFLCLHVQ